MYQMLEPVMSNVVCNMNLIYERGGEFFQMHKKNSFTVRFPGTASNFEQIQLLHVVVNIK